MVDSPGWREQAPHRPCETESRVEQFLLNRGVDFGLMIENIDAWFEKIRAAGYQTQTEYVWTCASLGRSFLFYDDDGNMIQMWEQAATSGWG